MIVLFGSGPSVLGSSICLIRKKAGRWDIFSGHSEEIVILYLSVHFRKCPSKRQGDGFSSLAKPYSNEPRYEYMLALRTDEATSWQPFVLARPLVKLNHYSYTYTTYSMICHTDPVRILTRGSDLKVINLVLVYQVI